MGMFDWYQPAPEPRCRVCGEPMTVCQGKDGPNALLVWKQGDELTSIQPADEPMHRLDDFDHSRPFSFACWCPNDHSAEFLGEIEDGVWVRTFPS